MMKNDSALIVAVLLALTARAGLAFDAAAELAALKAKHPEAAERVSPFRKMNVVKVLQILSDETEQAYKEKDWVACERVARDGIDLKTDPELFYYNLACALARQKKLPEARIALEQCVVAGQSDADQARKDEDLVALRGEKRFAEFLELMACNATNPPSKSTIKVRDGRIALSADTVVCQTEAHNEHFFAALEPVSNACPIVYQDRNRPHRGPIRKALPELDLIEMEYPEEMKALGQDVGEANVIFAHPQIPSLPVIAATDVTGGPYPGASLATVCGLDFSRMVAFENVVCNGDVLQIASAGRDYGVDGFDRFVVNAPLFFTYVGGEAEQRFFVRTIVRALRAMPAPLRDEACKSGILLDVIQRLVRLSQRGVRDAGDYLTGRAHPPAFFADQIDAERLVKSARAMKRLPPRTPALLLDGVPKPSGLPANELETEGNGLRHRWSFSMTARSSSFAFRGLDGTTEFHLADQSTEKTGKIVWKVLQGDPAKVRVREKGGTFDIEVDYHAVFTVTNAHGQSMKTSRVDIGFFREEAGEFSLPYVLNVAMPPHDTRTYDEKNRLAVADYSTPQIHPTNFVSRPFTRGFWRDTYHYDDDGSLLGWTRDEPRNPGRDVKWLASGFVGIVARDAEGRPARLARPLVYEWEQTTPVDGSDDTPNAASVASRVLALRDDDELSDPRVLGFESSPTNASSGNVTEIPYADYAPKRCNPYADFGPATNGVSYPLSMELDDADRIFDLVLFGYPRTNQQLANDTCEDGEKLQMERPPRKMRFSSAQIPSLRDWPDLSDVELAFATNLVQIPDGAYRLRRDAGEGECHLSSIAATRREWNAIMSAAAAKRMDAEGYARCTTNELERALKCLGAATNATSGVVGWHVVDEFCLVASAEGAYSFVCIDTNATKRAIRLADFRFFPPADIMGAVLGGRASNNGNTENDLAVLIYCGVVNFNSYDAGEVYRLLTSSARKGVPAAFSNLGVFFANLGDPDRADQYERFAGQIGEHIRYMKLRESRFGETNVTGWVKFLEAEMDRKPSGTVGYQLVHALGERQAQLVQQGPGPVSGAQVGLIEARMPKMILKCAESGDLLAMEAAVRSKGRIGVTNVVRFAQRLVKTGVGSEEAYCELADAYREGLGGLETNETRAVELYTYAAERLNSARAKAALKKHLE